jgi:hypothetical protein
MSLWVSCFPHQKSFGRFTEIASITGGSFVVLFVHYGPNRPRRTSRFWRRGELNSRDRAPDRRVRIGKSSTRCMGFSHASFGEGQRMPLVRDECACLRVNGRTRIYWCDDFLMPSTSAGLDAFREFRKDHTLGKTSSAIKIMGITGCWCRSTDSPSAAHTRNIWSNTVLVTIAIPRTERTLNLGFAPAAIARPMPAIR